MMGFAGMARTSYVFIFLDRKIFQLLSSISGFRIIIFLKFGIGRELDTGDQFSYNHTRPSAAVVQRMQFNKCCTWVIKDQAEDNRACPLAASRVYKLILCFGPQPRSRDLLASSPPAFMSKVLGLAYRKR